MGQWALDENHTARGRGHATTGWGRGSSPAQERGSGVRAIDGVNRSEALALGWWLEGSGHGFDGRFSAPEGNGVVRPAHQRQEVAHILTSTLAYSLATGVLTSKLAQPH